MRAKVLQETTFARDIHGKPLNVGDVAEIDPSLGGSWACTGIVEIVEHDTPAGPAGLMVAEPLPEPEVDEAEGRIYRDENGARVRDYQAERMARKRAAADGKPKKKRKEKDGTDESGPATE